MVRTRGKATTVAATENNSGSDVELNSDSATPEANDKPLKSINQKTTRRRISTENEGSDQEMAAQDKDSDVKKEDSEEETPQVQKPRKTIFVCEVSTEDTPGPSRRRNKSMKKSSLRFYKRETRTHSRNDERMELESYYESDEEEEFVHSRRQRYWESDEANSVRRSTRQRKPARNLCDSSWIFSTKNPKGYPTLRDEDQDEVVGCRRSSRLLSNQHSSQSHEDLEKDSKSESDGDNEPVENGINTDGDADEIAQENKEHKKAPRRLRRNGTETLHDEEDMYSKVKRRNTKPSYNNYSSRLSKAKRLRSKKRPARRYTAPSTEESTSETEDEAEDTTDEETEGSQNDAAKEADADIEGRRAKGKYLLRKIQPANKQANDNKSSSRSSTPPPRYRDRDSSRLFRSPAHRTLRKPRQTAQNDSSTSSSSDDEERFERRKNKSMLKARSRFLPMNITAEDLGQGVLKERSKIGSSLADVDPMALDKNVTFESVGGLDSYISSLKEMILFPLVYPEVFHKFSIQPPRGVLFYGPPGTGKTLVARALSNECGGDGRRVAFFMRKGADCLSKWVGESERQLRLLFDQAYQMRPSIIFFDEIDGLAPVRSTRQDQIHSSIVSTLLALMDGLDSRGEVVVIGATNRLDAIDPALRRPGRFDREFFFPLPSMMARKEILGIHLKSWDPLPSPALVETLAEKTVGYCGADLKALCAEAALVSLRRRYPQIYDAKQKLLLDLSQISVDERDFFTAMNSLTPASHRSGAACGKPLSATVAPLLSEALQSLIQRVEQVFPQALHVQNMKGPTNQIKFGLQGQRFSSRLYVTRDQGSHLTPALLHFLERVPVHRLDLTTLFGLSARTPEEACVQTFQEARRNVPSIVYLPQVGCWWNTLSETVRATLFSVIRELDPELPVLILASDETDYSEMPDELTSFFSDQDEEIFAVPDFSDEQRRHFFSSLFETAKKLPHVPETVEKNVEPLPVAPLPPPRQLSDKEKARIEMKEEFTLRELRIFLREILAKLARNKLFYMFTRPVDVEEVPDYLDIIKQPMDLETMMTKIDDHCYESAKDFLADIDLICSNALEYNPSKTPEDKMIRHRAFTLRDTAYALIKAEMDTDFEDQCQEISRSRKVRHNTSESVSTPAPTEVNQETVAEALTVATASAPSAKEPKEKVEPSKQKRKKTSSWARGVVPRRSAKRNKTDESIDTSEADKSEVLMEVTNGTSEALAVPEATEDQINNSTGSNQTDSEVLENQEGSGLNVTSGGVIVDHEHLELLLQKAVQISKGFSLQRILRVHLKLNRVVAKYSDTQERSKLTQDMEEVLNCIQKGKSEN